MTDRPNERIAYFNGAIVPESQVTVSFRDRGFKLGDAAFDTSRTFGGRIFKLEAHVERLYRTLNYLRIDPGLSPSEMISISHEVLERNLPLLEEDGDYWVSQRISRGEDRVGGDIHEHAGGPTVIVECTPLPLRARAKYFHEGIRVATPSVHRITPGALSPNAKTHNYLNLVIGDLEVRAQDPEGWAILLDNNGNFAEGMGSNIFLVKDGIVATPKANYVLAGITRATVIDLTDSLGIPLREDDIGLYEAYNADEAFVTSTSFCICPVRSINGVDMSGGWPGPVTKQLTDAFVTLVGYDFVEQYRRHL